MKKPLCMVLLSGLLTLQCPSWCQEANNSQSEPQVINQPADTSANIAVAEGTTAIIDLSSGSAFNVGNIVNNGTVYAISTNPQFTSGTINASSFVNTSLFTTVLPAGGLAGYNAIPNFSLNIIANQLLNTGTISSSGALNITANTLNNTGTLASAAGMNLQAASLVNQGAITAANLSIVSSSLTNSGVIQATGNSVLTNLFSTDTLSVLNNITSAGVLSQLLDGSSFVIDNSGGTLASLGDLVIAAAGPQLLLKNDNGLVSAGQALSLTTQGSLADVKSGITVQGGHLSAAPGSTINFNSPDGHVSVQAHSLGNGVSIDGGSAVIGVTSGLLKIDRMNLTGDPVLSGGVVDLSGLVGTSLADDLIVLSNGDIMNSGGPGTITRTGAGADTHLAAGVTFVVLNAACTTCVAGVDYLITGTSGAGDVNLSNVSFNAPGTINIEAPSGSVSVGGLTSGSGAATVSANNTISVNYTAGANLATTPLVLNAPGAKTINVSGGDLILGPNAITATGAGVLNVNNPAGTINFGPAAVVNATVVNSQSPVIFSGNAIDLATPGSLNFVSSGQAFLPFLSSTLLNGGAGGILFPGGGSGLVLNFAGSGGAIRDTSAAPFTGLSNTNLVINSAGDIIFEASTFDNRAGTGTINMRVPNDAAYLAGFASLSSNPAGFRDITSTGGTLLFMSNGRIFLEGAITSNGPNFQDTGGILALSGIFGPGGLPATQTGITVTGTVMSNGGYTALNVVNTDTSASPGFALIDIQGSVGSTGTFINGSGPPATGGGVELAVNDITPGGLVSQVAIFRPTLMLANDSGNLQILPGASTNYQPYLGGVTLADFVPGAGPVQLYAQGSGAIIINNNGGATPGLITGTGRLVADGGIVYVGGTSYDGEINIDGTVTGQLPYMLPSSTTGGSTGGTDGGTTGGTTAGGTTGGTTGGDTGGSSGPPQSTILNTDAVPVGETAQTQGPVTINVTQTVVKDEVIGPCQVATLVYPWRPKLKDPPMLMALNNTAIGPYQGPEAKNDPDNVYVNIDEGGALVVASASHGVVAIHCTDAGCTQVRIPKGATMMIEAKGTSLAATSLSGPSLRMGAKDGKPGEVVTIANGNRVVMYDAEEDLIPADGLEPDTQWVAGHIAMETKNLNYKQQVVKNKKKFLENHDFRCNLDPYDKQLKALKDRLRDLSEWTPEEWSPTPGPQATPFKRSSSSGHVLPIGYTQLAPSSAVGGVITKELQSGSMRVLTGSRIATLGKQLRLMSGEVVLSAEDGDQSILAGDCLVAAKKGSHVLVSRNEHQTSVINLWESGNGTVSVSAGGARTKLLAGHQAAIMEPGEKPLAAMSRERFARRDVRIHTVSRGRQMFSADVSLATVLYSDPLMARIARSKAGLDKSLIERMIKLSAALAVATASHGSYQLPNPK